MRGSLRCRDAACLAVALALLSGGAPLPAGPREGEPFEVRWSGELKKVMMQGDLRGTIDLKALGKLPHIYAVGALEGLAGEVTLVDGAASIARVRDGKVVVQPVAEGKACVLVYAQVKRWAEAPLRGPVRSLGRLEASVVEAAKKQGLDVRRPFPFLVRGKAAAANYHVLRHPGDVKDPPDLHGKAQVKYLLKDGAVELVGFYSDQHLGVFTCGGNLHVHVRSADGKVSGHLDEVALADGARLFLPAGEGVADADAQAREAVAQFFQAFKARDVEGLLKAADIPFCREGGKNIARRGDLEQFFRKALEVREPSKDTLTVKAVTTLPRLEEAEGKFTDEERKEAEEALGTDHRVVKVEWGRFGEGKHRALILVRLRAGKARVVGIL